MAGRKTTKPNETEDLKKQVADLTQLVTALIQSQTQQKVQENVVVESKAEELEEINFDEIKYDTIPDNKYIKVINLENNPLTLSTEGFGQGKKYDFEKFGQARNITYGNLSDILYNNEGFAKSGRFYVCDKAVITNHELIDVYKNILTKEQMENILSYSDDKIADLFSRTTLHQRDTVVSLIIERMNAGEKVDLNKIAIISKIYGFDIVSRSK